MRSLIEEIFSRFWKIKHSVLNDFFAKFFGFLSLSTQTYRVACKLCEIPREVKLGEKLKCPSKIYGILDENGEIIHRNNYLSKPKDVIESYDLKKLKKDEIKGKKIFIANCPGTIKKSRKKLSKKIPEFFYKLSFIFPLFLILTFLVSGSLLGVYLISNTIKVLPKLNKEVVVQHDSKPEKGKELQDSSTRGKDLDEPKKINNSSSYQDLLAKVLINLFILLALIDLTFLVVNFNGRESLKSLFPNPKEKPPPSIRQIAYENKKDFEKFKEEIKRISLVKEYTKKQKISTAFVYIKHLCIAILSLILLEVFIKLFKEEGVSEDIALLVGVSLVGASIILWILKIWDIAMATEHRHFPFEAQSNQFEKKNEKLF